MDWLRNTFDFLDFGVVILLMLFGFLLLVIWSRDMMKKKMETLLNKRNTEMKDILEYIYNSRNDTLRAHCLECHLYYFVSDFPEIDPNNIEHSLCLGCHKKLRPGEGLPGVDVGWKNWVVPIPDEPLKKVIIK